MHFSGNMDKHLNRVTMGSLEVWNTLDLGSHLPSHFHSLIRFKSATSEDRVVAALAEEGKKSTYISLAVSHSFCPVSIKISESIWSDDS